MSDNEDELKSLQIEYVPRRFVDRKNVKTALSREFSRHSEGLSRDLHLFGPVGSGKTHLISYSLARMPSKIQTCHISCTRANSQYKALVRLLRSLTDQDLGSGHHISHLQREIRQQLTEMPAIIVLDDLDFLLLNDGEDLLYFLSRLSEQIRLILITSSVDLQSEVDQRILSSLRLRTIEAEGYTEDQVFEILAARAETALPPQSLEQRAVQEIAETTQNMSLALCWLRIAAEQATTITWDTVQEVKADAFHRYLDRQLEPFSEHHQLVTQAVMELTEENHQQIQTGTVYSRYEEICDVYSEECLSQRRISDILKELETLNLIEADYHYGGKKGKTREIELTEPFSDISGPVIHYSRERDFQYH